MGEQDNKCTANWPIGITSINVLNYVHLFLSLVMRL